MEEELSEELQHEISKQSLVEALLAVLQNEGIECDEENARQLLSKLIDEL